MTRRMKARNLLVVLSALALGAGALIVAADTEIEDGILDWMRLAEKRIPADAEVVVHPFDASNADLGTGAEGGKPKRVEAARTMQREAPEILAQELVAQIEQHGPFPTARLAGDGAPGENALVVEGRFTTIDPGSRAKRYWVGFGAGKGVVEIEGTIKDGSGRLLGEFRHKRLTVIGAFGGDYKAKIRADCERFGEDLAEFLQAWATDGDFDD